MSQELKAVHFRHQNVIRIYGEFRLSNRHNRELAMAMELASCDLTCWWDCDQHTLKDIQVTMCQVREDLK